MRHIFSAVLGAVLAITALHSVEATAGEPVATKSTPTEMVAALANKNRPPDFVDHELLRFDKVPLFPADHDWKEYERVGKALWAIDRGMTPELWEELLKHTRDNRYSLTLVKTGPGLPDEDAGKDFTVGEFCEAIAHSCLSKLYSRHSVSAENDLKPWERIEPTAGIRNLVEWRKQRAAKPLWQLQLEACTLALKNVETLDKANAAQKATIRKGIQSEIDKLNAAKKPTLLPSYICADGGVIHINGWHEASFNASRAADLRRQYGDRAGKPREK